MGLVSPKSRIRIFKAPPFHFYVENPLLDSVFTAHALTPPNRNQNCEDFAPLGPVFIEPFEKSGLV
jgi:hypothetical protein